MANKDNMRSKTLNDVWNRLLKIQGTRSLLEPRAINNVTNYIQKIMKGGAVVDDFDVEFRQTIDRRQTKVIHLLKQIIDGIKENLNKSNISSDELNQLQAKLDALSKDYPLEAPVAEIPAPVPEIPAPVPAQEVPTGPSKEQLQNELKELEGNANAKTQDIGNMEKQLDELVQKHIDDTKILEESEEKVNELEANLTKIKAEIEQTRGRLLDNDSQQNKLKGDLETVRSELSESESQIEKHRKMLGNPEQLPENTEESTSIFLKQEKPEPQTISTPVVVVPQNETVPVQQPPQTSDVAPGELSASESGTIQLERNLNRMFEKNQRGGRSSAKIIDIDVSKIGMDDSEASFHFKY